MTLRQQSFASNKHFMPKSNSLETTLDPSFLLTVTTHSKSCKSNKPVDHKGITANFRKQIQR